MPRLSDGFLNLLLFSLVGAHFAPTLALGGEHQISKSVQNMKSSNQVSNLNTDRAEANKRVRAAGLAAIASLRAEYEAAPSPALVDEISAAYDAAFAAAFDAELAAGSGSFFDEASAVNGDIEPENPRIVALKELRKNLENLELNEMLASLEYEALRSSWLKHTLTYYPANNSHEIISDTGYYYCEKSYDILRDAIDIKSLDYPFASLDPVSGFELDFGDEDCDFILSSDGENWIKSDDDNAALEAVEEHLEIDTDDFAAARAALIAAGWRYCNVNSSPLELSNFDSTAEDIENTVIAEIIAKIDEEIAELSE